MDYHLSSYFDVNPFVIKDIPGFTPEVSLLISMMNYARTTTLRSVENLSVEQLDYLADENSNSIGALLLHIASVETAYQKSTFEQRDLNDEEMEIWGAALELGARGRREINGYPLTHYVDILHDVRQRTLDEFRTRSDEWLFEEFPFWNNKPANYYFTWFHVFEDELSHRGQIRIIRKQLTQR